MLWLDAQEEVPYWLDMNKTIEAVLNDGSTVTGIIKQYDMTAGPDESPLFHLKIGDKELNWFDDVKYYRFIT